MNRIYTLKDLERMTKKQLDTLSVLQAQLECCELRIMDWYYQDQQEWLKSHINRLQEEIKKIKK